MIFPFHRLFPEPAIFGGLFICLWLRQAISYKVKKQAGGLRERVDIILYRHEMVYVTILETVIKYISEQMHDWSNILLIKYFGYFLIYS